MQVPAQSVLARSAAARLGAPPPRLFFIDNLRWTTIALVVSMHAAVTYSGVGRWYYVQKPLPDLPIRVVFATYQSFLQAFFMGLLFFIAGYFVPGSFDRKGAAVFLRDRAVRLGVPSLLYMVVIGPLTEYYVAMSWSPDRQSSFLHEWVAYARSGRILSGSGPLWFCLALLIFCILYCFFRLLAPRDYGTSVPVPNSRAAAAFILLMALATFIVRIVQPMGTAVFNMQLCFFSQYALLFCAGLVAYRQNWLIRIPYSFGTRWFAISLLGGIALWCILIPASGALGGNIGPLNGGLTWQSAAMSCWESFVCVGVCLGLIVIFRERFNTRGAAARFLSDNAFAVYVIHPPILIGVARALDGLAVSPLLKFPLLAGLSIAANFLISAFFVRRVPGLRHILS